MVKEREKHFQYSSIREEYLEYVFLGLLAAEAWKRERFVEILRCNTDAFGYDLVLDCDGRTRHVQLKASFLESSTTSQKISTLLMKKPSGCVIWQVFDTESLEIMSFRWFGANVGEVIPSLGNRTAKHTKANSKGVKSERRNHRVLNKGDFAEIESMDRLFELLFGPDEPSDANS